MKKTIETHAIGNDLYSYVLSGSRDHEIYEYKNGEINFKLWKDTKLTQDEIKGFIAERLKEIKAGVNL